MSYRSISAAVLAAMLLASSQAHAQTVVYAYDAPAAVGTYTAYASPGRFRRAWRWSRMHLLPILNDYVNVPPIVNDLLNNIGNGPNPGGDGGAPAEEPIVFSIDDETYRNQETQYCAAARVTLSRLVELRKKFPEHTFTAPTDCNCAPQPGAGGGQPTPGGQIEFDIPPGVKFGAPGVGPAPAKPLGPCAGAAPAPKAPADQQKGVVGANLTPQQQAAKLRAQIQKLRADLQKLEGTAAPMEPAGPGTPPTGGNQAPPAGPLPAPARNVSPATAQPAAAPPANPMR
jgi:hypothetical protein